jgi:hypothetical protein
MPRLRRRWQFGPAKSPTKASGISGFGEGRESRPARSAIAIPQVQFEQPGDVLGEGGKAQKRVGDCPIVAENRRTSPRKIAYETDSRLVLRASTIKSRRLCSPKAHHPRVSKSLRPRPWRWT